MEFKLIIKKINNTLTSGEEQVFKKWFEQSQVHRDYYNSVKNNYDKELDYVDIEKGWQSIQTKIQAPKPKTYLWKYAVAASVVALITFGLIFNKKDTVAPIQTEVAVEKEPISIGTDKATLTLGDGSNVTLEKGKTYQTNNIVSNGEALVYSNTNNSKPETVYNHLTIPRGGQFQITLSDGTQVWLNSESQLKYPVAFLDGAVREVELVYGEAYFDVSPSSKHKGAKFKVINQNQEVEVLGTEFNIKAYKEESKVYTTLVEGKVEVGNNVLKETLKPNQQSIVNITDSSIAIKTVDVYSETSWRKGLFSFKSKPLKEIMVVLSRWYDVEINFENIALGEVKFNGVLSKNDKIEEILDAIKNTNFINAYEINQKEITIK